MNHLMSSDIISILLNKIFFSLTLINQLFYQYNERVQGNLHLLKKEVGLLSDIDLMG